MIRAPRPLAQLASAALLGTLVVSCSSTSTAKTGIAEVQDLTRQGRYEAAARRAADLLDEVPESSPYRAEAVQASRDVSLASGMEVARRLTLADQDDDALALLAELDERYPGSTVVAAWTERTKRKLADRWFEVARSAQARESFEAARVAYAKAIEYDPNYALAEAALSGLTNLEGYRAGLAQDYYYDGVRTLTDEKLNEARSSFSKSYKYDEESERTQRRISEVDREQARARVDYAEAELVAKRRYSAAATEYAAAARLDPSSIEIAERLEVLKAEAKVTALLSEADSSILRSEFDKAEAKLRKAADLTVLQTDLVDERLSGIDGSRAEAQYQRALNFQYDFRFPEAIAAFNEILDEREFYKDTRARLDTLSDYVSEAKRLYAEAAAAADDAKKLELYRQIELFWPDYEDVAEKIRTLAKSQ
ncbi:MAG: hypothetical protein AAF957_00360 [Planctomycetota bacterium]